MEENKFAEEIYKQHLDVICDHEMSNNYGTNDIEQMAIEHSIVTIEYMGTIIDSATYEGIIEYLKNKLNKMK